MINNRLLIFLSLSSAFLFLMPSLICAEPENFDKIPIFRAIADGNLMAVNAYIGKGGDVNLVKTGKEGNSAVLTTSNLLCYAISRIKVDIALYLLKQPDIDCNVFYSYQSYLLPQRTHEVTPLQLVIESLFEEDVENRGKLLQTLLDKNANPNLQSPNGPLDCVVNTPLGPLGAACREDTPLGTACRLLDVEAVDILLKHKANPNAVDSKGRTILYRLLKYYLQTVSLKIGTDIYDERRTSTIKNRQKRFIKIVKLLIKYGANLIIQPPTDGDELASGSLLHLFATHRVYEESQYYEFANYCIHEQDIPFYTQLLKCLIPPSSQKTLREICSTYTYIPLDVIKIIESYQKGLNIDFRDKEERTPLAATVQKGLKGHEEHYIPILRLLKTAAQADINPQDNRGNTPLHYAASSGNTKITSTLLELGADSSIRNKEGKTALQLTYNQTKIQSMKWLLLVPAVCIKLFLIKKWRDNQQRKQFALLVQKLVTLKQKLQNGEIDDAFYKAHKDFLLKPYQKNPVILEKIEAEVAHIVDLGGDEWPIHP